MKNTIDVTPKTQQDLIPHFLLSFTFLFDMPAQSQNEDWWDELSESDKNHIEEGVRQADNENFIEDSEARKSINDFLKATG